MVCGRKRKDAPSREAELNRRQMRRGIHSLLPRAIEEELVMGAVCPEELFRETILVPEVFAMTNAELCGEMRVVGSSVAVNMILPPTTVFKSLKAAGYTLHRDVPVLLAKGLELLVSELTIRAFMAAKMEAGPDARKPRLTADHLTAAVSGNPKFHFLRDQLPHDELVTILNMHQGS